MIIFNDESTLAFQNIDLIQNFSFKSMKSYQTNFYFPDITYKAASLLRIWDIILISKLTLLLDATPGNCDLPVSDISDCWGILSSSIIDLAFLARTPQNPFLDSFMFFIDVYS